jgi:hypothetical protein
MLALVGMLAPAVALAHPHIWIQQLVRVVAKDGKYTHVEIEWRFDPFSSEIEIPLIDEDHNGKVSAQEAKLLADEMMPELQKFGYMSWINTGGKDFRPAAPPQFSARIDDPASFLPPDWDRSAGDKAGMPMPPNKRAGDPAPPRKKGPRNLVYVMRFALPSPANSFRSRPSIPTISSASRSTGPVPAGCGWPSTRATRPSSSAVIRSLPTQ